MWYVWAKMVNNRDFNMTMVIIILAKIVQPYSAVTRKQGVSFNIATV